jgi:hypothetical protein
MKVRDYIIDTFIVNMVVIVIVIPWYYLTGMPIESIKIVFISFFTIGWVSSFPVPIVLKWFRERYPY